MKCGICHCDDSHSGRFCECDSNTAVLGDHEAACRSDNATDILCNDRGSCVCGVCECHTRPNPTEVKILFLFELYKLNDDNGLFAVL